MRGTGELAQRQRIHVIERRRDQVAVAVEAGFALTAQTVAAASQQARASAEQGARAVRETVAGMAERAALVGGTLHAGPAPEGRGWRVVADLPVDEGAPS